MKLSIVSVHNHGDQTKEYVWLKADSDAKAWSHILFDTTYTKEGKVSSLLRHMYWIPVAVEKGDSIVVYTRAGKDSSAENSDNSTTYHCYWGLKEPIWNDDGDCAMLVEIETWTHKKAK